jgi:membrane associated rhomboid family serine protease
MVGMEPRPEIPPPPVEEHCYRHPNVATGVHCTRCGRPICTECMVPAPVGHQCPTCVEEARREFRKGYGRRVAVADAKSTSATTVLVVAIVALYAVEVAAAGAGSLIGGPTPQKLYDLGGAAGVGIASGQYWRMFTAIFLHAGILHLAFNCYALWIFGQIVEQELGRARFLIIFFLTGVFASAASYAFEPSALVVGVGASGAIFGIFGAFVAYNWRRRQTALGAARLRSAILILVINAVLNVGLAGAIDWRAHVGGFVSGLVVGFAAEGFGRMRNERLAFALGCAGVIAATVMLTVWRTAQIKALYPQFF